MGYQSLQAVENQVLEEYNCGLRDRIDELLSRISGDRALAYPPIHNVVFTLGCLNVYSYRGSDRAPDAPEPFVARVPASEDRGSLRP